MTNGRIVAAQDLTQEMDRKVREYTELHRLAYENEISVVKACVDYRDLAMYLPLALTDFSAGKKDTFPLKRLVSTIQEKVTSCPVEIVRMFQCGYEPYGWGVVFRCGGREYELVTPNIPAMTAGNYQDAYKGRLVLFACRSPSFSDAIAYAYDIEDIAKAFRDSLSPSPA